MPTHGSITKAGKVRSQTPKFDGKERKHVIPRQRGRINSRKRLELGRRPGQNPGKNFRR
jgi:small subunit ribosomal protein S30e